MSTKHSYPHSLEVFFRQHPKAAIAFSGGVDSAYLLYAAISCGAKLRAYYVKSPFQPQFELDDAIRFAESLHADLRILSVDVLSNPKVAQNPADRCFYCKEMIFKAIRKEAERDGFPVILDGTNASDDSGDRPGMRALAQLSIHSPLRECQLTKDKIRLLSKEAGLFTWNKPAYACLATRVPCDTPITRDMLQKTERAEDYLTALGFSDFRVRMLGDGARLQVPNDQMERVLSYKDILWKELRQYYAFVLLDLQGRENNE